MRERITGLGSVGAGVARRARHLLDTPCKPAYLPDNISAALDPKCRVQFGEQEGLGLSLTSAVVGLCRLPAICTAVSRLVFATASADHVDDPPTIDTFEAHGSGQASTNTVHGFTGADCHAEATIPMGGQRVFLRVAATTAAAHENVIENATAAITSRYPSHKTTSSLRRKADWKSTASQCRLSRFPLWQLQAQTDYSLRCTRVVGPAPRPLIVYSNASWEPAPGIASAGSGADTDRHDRSLCNYCRAIDIKQDICQLRRRTGHGQRSGLRRYHQDRTWQTALERAST